MDPANTENQTPVNTAPESSSKMKMVGILILVVFGFIVLILLMMNNKNKTGISETGVNTQIQATATPTSMPERGFFNLTTTTTSATVGKPILISITGNSDNEDMTGYDILVKYDTSAFNFVSAVSNITDFNKIYPFKQTDHVTLTATKSLQSKLPIIFTDSKITTLTFTPIKAGSYVFEIKSRIGKETTSMVNAQTKKINPALNSITINVQ
ncbi:MAG: cohesin domain-containing protein [Nitrosarchaeum sp.]|nr:cohesin domain-containing protein [Nitrosarchaeum sp.]